MFGGLSRSGGKGHPQRETPAHAGLPGRNRRHEASAVSLCMCVCIGVCVCVWWQMEHLRCRVKMTYPTENANEAVCTSFYSSRSDVIHLSVNI